MEQLLDNIYLISGVLFSIGAGVLAYNKRTIWPKCIVLGVVLVWIGMGIASFGPNQEDYRSTFKDGSEAIVFEENLLGTYFFSFGFLFISAGFLGVSINLKNN